MENIRKIHRIDNVLVATKDLAKGHNINVNGNEFYTLSPIPFGHKIACNPIAKGENVIKYGYTIGTAISNIQVGEHVHTHNVKTNLNDNLDYSYETQKLPMPEMLLSNQLPQTFWGYQRKNGDVGIRNELWIIPTVGCVNGQAKQILERLKAEVDISHIDALEVLSHQYGCSQLGDDHSNTQKALAAAIRHPNAGAVLVLGLGCENNQVEHLQKCLGAWDKDRVKFLVAQDVEDEVALGLQYVKELSEIMKLDERVETPISKLRIGLKCGGSDGFSGITANPLLGVFSDWLIAQGGSTVLTEIPEMFGAETVLMNRAKNKEVFDKTVGLINGFKDYFRQNNQVVYENPSPGNKEGGITTLEDKSLGAIQKGGDSEVVDVLAYGEQIKEQGLSLLWGPGNDLVSSSALGMAGCQMVLFTTGRGTPFGSFVPTLKVASNSTLFNKKQNWMDFDAGTILEASSMEEVSAQFIKLIVETASGKKLKHELANFKEIAIFKSGVTL